MRSVLGAALDWASFPFFLILTVAIVVGLIAWAIVVGEEDEEL